MVLLGWDHFPNRFFDVLTAIKDSDSRLYGEVIFTKAWGDSGGASKIGSSWLWSENCFWVGLLFWPTFAADPAALGGGTGLWFTAGVLETRAGLDVVFGFGGAAVSGAGLPQVVVPLRLIEPDFTKKKPPLSCDAVLMETNE